MANTPTSISPSALQQLRRLEGAVPYVYDDGDGTWPKRKITSYATKGHATIGVGHLIKPEEREYFKRYMGGPEMPEQEMLALLGKDVQAHAHPLRAKIRVPITQAMWDALVLQAFNTGPYTAAINAAIARINEKDWRGAQTALANGAKTSKGKTLAALVQRRAEEAQLFLRDGIPGAAQKLQESVQRRVNKRVNQHLRKVRRLQRKQVILGIGAAVFSGIALLALAASQRVR
jgi:GH24 family phage-related lysozyme (muramidase)